jgi:MFS transporter, AAHS family, 3-hydroxyphenylpropionic acid transporter
LKNSSRSADPRVRSVVACCTAVALFEGLDIQSMGVAAPRLAPAFHLDPGQMGFVMSASTLGLMIGAALGGWLSDRFGRKSVIIVSMAALGVFSLATASAPNFDSLLGVRVLAGLGLGGAFPNLIALVSEVTPARLRVTALGLMYCGLPLGGAAAGAIPALHPAADWRPIFYVGGFGPLFLIPVLVACLPHARSFVEMLGKPPGAAQPGQGGASLFGAQTAMTLLLWVSYFFTLLVVYLLLNWLPSLLVAKGYSRVQGSSASIILNVGAVVGSILLGRLTDRGHPRVILTLTYAGMMASLAALAIGRGSALFAAAFAAGFFVIGGQLVLYAIAPILYPTAIRGTGIGAAIAVGRLGSIAGPLLAGALLAHGFGPSAVPVASVPGLVIAFAAAFILYVRYGTDKI